MAATVDPRFAIFRNSPVRPLMDLNSNGIVFAQQPSEEVGLTFFITYWFYNYCDIIQNTILVLEMWVAQVT